MRHYFPDQHSALESIPRATLSILDSHEALLGHTVPSLQGTSPDCPAASLAPAAPSPLSPQIAGDSIRVTVSGLAGHSGLNDPHDIFNHRDESQPQLWRSADAYRWARRTAQVTKVVERPTIVTGASATSYPRLSTVA